MKPIWKHIIATCCAILVVAYMVFGLWMSRHQVSHPECEHLRVHILDANQRQYVSSSEITQLVSGKGVNPVGKKASRIALQPIEDVVRTHSMVRTAECYKNINGDVTIALTQRTPVVRVLTGAETYFVDTDRKQMPVRASVTTPVLIATGQVSIRMAQQELSDFAMWLKRDAYWRKRITRVQVVAPHNVHLTQADGAAEIILGDWQGFEQKLNKLRHWYQADTLIHQQQYQQVDLRFRNQIVGIRN